MVLFASSSRLSLLALSCLGAVSVSHAISVPFTKRSTITSVPPTLAPRDQDSNDTFTFRDSKSIYGIDVYLATINVAGQNFEVILDTGSADVLLDTTDVDLSSLINTGIEEKLRFGDGSMASGPIYVGNSTFGNFTVDQAFISAPGTNITSNGGRGLLGLGLPLLSSINKALSGTGFIGKTLLENIFESEPLLPTIMTFQLSRSLSNGSTDGGVFTIGEVDSDFVGISQEPKLHLVSSTRWEVLLDGVIINGKNVTEGIASNITGKAPAGQAEALLDTGSSLALIPKTYLDAIYGSIPGAVYLPRVRFYSVPCDTKLNVSFVFGGVEYPVHPIDAVIPRANDDPKVSCRSGFLAQEDTSNTFLLGATFLRNVYSLFSFGQLMPNSSEQAFIQLLSTTDANKAYAEFDSLSQQRNDSIIKRFSGGNNGSDDSGDGGSSADSNAALRALPLLSSPTSLLSLLGLCVGVLLV